MPVSNQEWKTREGQVIPISAMEDSHLINSMLYLHRRRTEWADAKRAWAWERVLVLAEEAQRRRLMNDPITENELLSWLDQMVVTHDRQRNRNWHTPYNRRPTPAAGVRESQPVQITAKSPQPLGGRKLDLSDW